MCCTDDVILGIIIKEIHGYYKTKALASGIKDPGPGAISFTQLAGSALNNNDKVKTNLRYMRP